LSSLAFNHYPSRARELDDKVADELEAMERNAVLPKRWNGPSEREHLNTQRRAWSHAKTKDRDDKLAYHDEFTAELLKLSSQQADSLKLEKSLREQIQTLRDIQNANWKEEIKTLQQQIEAEKEKRRGYKNRRQVVNKSIQELKDNGLSGARLHGRRPAHSAESMIVEKELFTGPASGTFLLCKL
jgi:DNA repair exonuclease SbcCD ATPase subunit